MLRKPLKKCSNGCDAPPHPPSWVLCKECFEELDKKMQELDKKMQELCDSLPEWKKGELCLSYHPCDKPPSAGCVGES